MTTFLLIVVAVLLLFGYIATIVESLPRWDLNKKGRTSDWMESRNK